MNVIILNDNNNISNIISGINGGKDRKCILSETNIERLSPIIRLAHKLELESKEVYIQVKFDSIYNPRPKRLEIVTKKNNIIEIYKFSKKSSFEKECIEVQRVIDELNINTNFVFKGFIVLSIDKKDLENLSSRVSDISTDISIYIE